ncbi:pentapeptide repeat-containing protein [Leptothoe sp. LEGE 181152]|nr:pentapeptide repeat-containing protein [Leptothoe sp. LEGE 181152]
MSAQEPFDHAATPADLMPQTPRASERFTVDYNPDPDFASIGDLHHEEMATLPLSSPMKVSVQLLIAIASTLITFIGLVLDSFWLISFGSLIALAISIRLAMPTLRAVVNDLSPEQRSLIVATPGLILGIYGLMQVSGINLRLLQWGATLNWNAIGALGDFLGALGQIFIAILALYVAWRQFIISRDLTTQQNLITQQQTIDAYFQGISELVLDDEGLLEDWPQERIIAEARTAAILGGIDGDGKAKVLRFLSRSKLLTPLARDQRLGRPILDGSGGYAEDRLNGVRVIDIGVMLAAADISGNDLRWVDLSGINLIRANLSQCELVRTDLTRTVLCDADLSGADLMGTRFFHGPPETATPRTRNDTPNYETGEFTGAVVEGMDLSNAQRLSETQRCYLCTWSGSKTRATIPGGCRDIPNRLGR